MGPIYATEGWYIGKKGYHHLLLKGYTPMPKGHKDLKDRILALIRYWRPILDLENWDVYINWNEKRITAGNKTDPEYKRCTLYFNLPRILRDCQDPRELEELVVHELTHSPLWLMARGLEDRNRTKLVEYIEETTTTTMSRALLRARAAGEDKEKKRRK